MNTVSRSNTYETHAAPQPILSVTAFNQAIAQLLERNCPQAWVKGEISNFTRAASGHWYFTLKDEQASVRCVMFRGRAQYAGFNPANGDKVELRAQVTLYAPRGDFQLNVDVMRQAGVGNLYEAFLKLKNKLQVQGYFDESRKKPIPHFPRTIGVITSPQAAALRDVITALQRRAPQVKVILYPTSVQGREATQQIVTAINTASQRNECEVLLLVRGGGSIEDLWCFNEEIVAQAILASHLPIISGVGHETDFTIADFTADLRAATPTAAAELAILARDEWLQGMTASSLALKNAMQRFLLQRAQQIDRCSLALPSPYQSLQIKKGKLVQLAQQLRHREYSLIEDYRHAINGLANDLWRTKPKVSDLAAQVSSIAINLQYQLQGALKAHQHHLAALQGKLDVLNPQRTLERGYAIIQDGQGRIVRSPDNFQPDADYQVKLAHGEASIHVDAVTAPRNK